MCRRNAAGGEINCVERRNLRKIGDTSSRDRYPQGTCAPSCSRSRRCLSPYSKQTWYPETVWQRTMSRFHRFATRFLAVGRPSTSGQWPQGEHSTSYQLVRKQVTCRHFAASTQSRDAYQNAPDTTITVRFAVCRQTLWLDGDARSVYDRWQLIQAQSNIGRWENRRTLDTRLLVSWTKDYCDIGNWRRCKRLRIGDGGVMVRRLTNDHRKHGQTWRLTDRKVSLF